jgi:hypothetical protein
VAGREEQEEMEPMKNANARPQNHSSFRTAVLLSSLAGIAIWISNGTMSTAGIEPGTLLLFGTGLLGLIGGLMITWNWI